MIGFAAVMAILVALTGVAAGVPLDGTYELWPIGDSAGAGAGSCTVEAAVGIGAGTDVKVNSETFRYDVYDSGLSLNLASTSQLSLTAEENVQAKFTLNGQGGEISITDTKELGDIARTTAKTAEFKASNLKPGNYVLHVNAFAEAGDDYDRFDITVGEGCN